MLDDLSRKVNAGSFCLLWLTSNIVSIDSFIILTFPMYKTSFKQFLGIPLDKKGIFFKRLKSFFTRHFIG